MKKIKVSSCGGCPFVVITVCDETRCDLDKSLKYEIVNKIHSNCPLKKEPVQIEIGE